MMISKKNKETIQVKANVRQLARKNPEQIVVVRSSSVYSQIARVGRVPQKSKERMILVNAINDVSKPELINGRIVKVEPVYIPMKVKDVLTCFGNQVNKLQINSQVYVENYVCGSKNK